MRFVACSRPLHQAAARVDIPFLSLQRVYAMLGEALIMQVCAVVI